MSFVSLDGVRFYFQSSGPASSAQPAIIFIHGSGGDSTVWHDQLEALSSTLHSTAADLPGHGRSGGRPSTDPGTYARWLGRFAESLRLDAFVLAGHSMGGIIAQQFARLFPEKLRGLILIGTGMRFKIPSRYFQILHRNFDAACTLSCRQAYAQETPAGIRDQGLAMLQRNGPDTLMHDLRLCSDFDSSGWIGSLSIPTLIIHGIQDGITPHKAVVRLAGVIRDSHLKYMQRSGHMPMQEQPEIFNREIAGFIKKRCSGHG